jgi:hypothetical protein
VYLAKLVPNPVGNALSFLNTVFTEFNLFVNIQHASIKIVYVLNSHTEAE